MDIVLGEEQLETLNKIKEFISSSDSSFVIQGYAGTGKTQMILELIKYLDNIKKNIVLCAPTHKAKLVLERFTEREAITLHKLLSLSPNIEIFELDFNSLLFKVGKSTLLFPMNGVIICDEASMVNDDLFSLLNQKAKVNNCRIIFVGDKAQLRPVNAKDHSLVFSLPNNSTLTKIYRQENESGLSAILPVLRNSVINRFDNHIGTRGSVICYSNAYDFLKSAIPYFRKAIKNSDILETKILAYTNNRVNAFNLKMKEFLFPNNNEYNKLEFLTCGENLEYNFNKYWNSMDYIITLDPVKTDIRIPSFMSLPGYNLSLYDSVYKTCSDISIISKEVSSDYFNSLAKKIEDVRIEAITLKNQRNRKSSDKWKEYYSIIGSFTTPVDLYFDNRLIKKKSFSEGYSSTIHKSQGSSINNVFIDMADVSICRDVEELRQLQYVGASRTKNNLYILQ